MRQVAPIKARQGGQHFAFVKPLAPRCGADRVGRFDDQERLIAIDDIDRLQLAFEVRRQLIAAQLHAFSLLPG